MGRGQRSKNQKVLAPLLNANQPENDRVRYTISESARQEVLCRLGELNREQYKEEVAEGYHGKTKTIATRSSSLKRQATQHDYTSAQHGLDFDAPHYQVKVVPAIVESGNQWGSIALDQILAWLEAHGGWFAKDVILKGCGASTESWDASLSELLDDDFIESRGDGDEVRYRAKP